MQRLKNFAIPSLLIALLVFPLTTLSRTGPCLASTKPSVGSGRD